MFTSKICRSLCAHERKEERERIVHKMKIHKRQTTRDGLEVNNSTRVSCLLSSWTAKKKMPSIAYDLAQKWKSIKWKYGLTFSVYWSSEETKECAGRRKKWEPKHRCTGGHIKHNIATAKIKMEKFSNRIFSIVKNDNYDTGFCVASTKFHIFSDANENARARILSLFFVFFFFISFHPPATICCHFESTSTFNVEISP